MALETATYINGLVPTNPLGNDPKSQGDDHLRLIKSTLKNTFPNVTGAVTVTQDQINAIGTPGVINFSGMVVGFTGTQAQIPAGWQLCNGVGNTALGPVPDLRQKFIIGSTGDEGSLPTGSTGGSATHTHTVTVNGHALTIDQIPSHTHVQRYRGAQSLVANSGANGSLSTGSGVYSTSITTESTGGGQTHSHTATTGSSNNLPPYYALAFIVKL
jgi:microcystin-dependent protein